MTKTQKQIILLLFLLSALYFIVFYFPNIVGSKNIRMVAVFEPDEAVPLQYLFHMIKPVETTKQALINFAFYGYYFYGFPYFAFSSITLLPVKFFNTLNNIPLVMLILRQGVSVLPMVASVWILVYLQTRFQSYKSIVLFLFLLSIPALVQNNFWWHPDSLAIFFAVLTILFLDHDGLRFGKYFFIAAVMCGYSAGIKGIGFYFFLTVFTYLLVGAYSKKTSMKKILFSAIGFLIFMGAGYIIANPILLYSSVRERYFNVMSSQSLLLTQGYEVFYPKGFLTSLPLVQEYYGKIIFLVAILGTCILGIIRRNNRLLHIIILSWTIPLSILVLSLIHFKFQYWLPVALPLFSTITVALPEKIQFSGWSARLNNRRWKLFIFQGLFILITLVESVLFIKSDIIQYSQQLNREDTNPSIKFNELAREALKPLPDNQTYLVYHDVRMYFPIPRGWKSESIFEMLNYDYIQTNGFDIIMLVRQRTLDYTRQNANPIDLQKYKQSYLFYSDAKKGQIKDYHLIFQNGYGFIFIRDNLYRQYFKTIQ